MFGFTKREVLIFLAGLLLTIVLTVFGTFYVIKHYVLLHDPTDPLVKQGGLTPGQQIRK
jgi:hypothetical protein